MRLILGKQNQCGSNPLLGKAYKLLSCSITPAHWRLLGGCDADLSCSFSLLLLLLLRVFTQLLRSFHPSRVLKVTPCTPSCFFSRVSEKWFVLASSPYALKLTFPIWTSEMTSSEFLIFQLIVKLIVLSGLEIIWIVFILH